MSRDHLSEQFRNAERAHLSPPDPDERPCGGYGCGAVVLPGTELCDECDGRYAAAGDHEPSCRCEECVWWARTSAALYAEPENDNDCLNDGCSL